MRIKTHMICVFIYSLSYSLSRHVCRTHKYAYGMPNLSKRQRDLYIEVYIKSPVYINETYARYPLTNATYVSWIIKPNQTKHTNTHTQTNTLHAHAMYTQTHTRTTHSLWEDFRHYLGRFLSHTLTRTHTHTLNHTNTHHTQSMGRPQ